MVGNIIKQMFFDMCVLTDVLVSSIRKPSKTFEYLHLCVNMCLAVILEALTIENLIKPT